MVDNRKKLCNNIKDKIVEISKKYRKKEDINEFKESVEEKLKNFKPSIMVYGVYNSGKSTLLNAIFGKKVASVADAPETDRVEAYEYNGYVIYDTPGINAPIEHEKITQNHLEKSELILFVLSNDGSFEEVYIYERIIKIVKSNKPILLVVNNKAGIEVNSSEEMEIYSKIEKNLKEMAKKEKIDNIEQKVDICLVDAKKAFKGKSENKNILLKKSNILELEKKIKEMLKNSSSENVINTLKNYIGSYIDKTIKIMENNISDEEIKKSENLISDIKRLKSSIFIKISNLIDLKSETLQYEIVNSLISDNSSEIEIIIKSTTKEIENSIKREIEYGYEKLKDKLEKVSVEKVHLSYDKEIPNKIIETQFPESKEKEENIIDILLDILLTKPFPIPTPLPIPPTIMKTIFELFYKKNHQREKALAELEVKKNQYMFAQSKAKSFIFDYKNELKRGLNDSLDEIFNEFIKKIRDKQIKYNEMINEVIRDKEELEKIIQICN